MHTHRIDIFHITYGDTVAGAVPHHLILDFLPSRNAAFHQNLSHPGETQAICQNLLQLDLVMGDTAAGATQRIGRAQHHRISDLMRKRHAVLDILHHQRRRAGFPDLLHRLLEFQTVLRLADRLRRGAQQRDAMRRQKARFIQLHAQIQAGLSAHVRQQAVRFLLADDLLQHPYRQRFDIYLICNVTVGHDGGRIGIHQNDFHPLLFQRAARLRSRIVKFRRLPDHNRSRADYEYSFYIRILRHFSPSASF